MGQVLPQEIYKLPRISGRDGRQSNTEWANPNLQVHMIKPLPTPPESLTEVLLHSIRIEQMIEANHKDIQKAQATRKKLQDLINKLSVK